MTIPAFEAVWQRLEEATKGRSPFNFMQLATLGMDGSPQVRTVVLRRSEPEGRLSFITDVRSPKIAEIAKDARVALVGYDPATSVQIRLTGIATRNTDEVERQAVWEKLRGGTLALFGAALAPGTPLGERGMPLVREAEGGVAVDPYGHFALIDFAVTHLDWLDLATTPHIRAAYYRDGSTWIAQRLAP